MIRCYVKAPSKKEAEKAAWDMDWTVIDPVDAIEYADIFRNPKRQTRLYEVKITAKREEGAK